MNQTILKNDVNTLKYWVVTSKGKRGPFDSFLLAESAAINVPKAEGETPRIVQLTETGQQILLG